MKIYFKPSTTRFLIVRTDFEYLLISSTLHKDVIVDVLERILKLILLTTLIKLIFYDMHAKRFSSLSARFDYRRL